VLYFYFLQTLKDQKISLFIMTASVHSPLLCHECPKSFENKKTLTDHLLTRAWESDLVPPSKKINSPCLLLAAMKIKKVTPIKWAWLLQCNPLTKRSNKYILLYSNLYSTTSILLQKSLNLTPIQGFLGRWLLAALLRYFAFSSPAPYPPFLIMWYLNTP